MRAFLPILLVAGLVAASLPVLADGGRGEERSTRASTEEGRGNANASHGPVGRFAVQATSHAVAGDYVSFSYDAAGIRGFAADGVPVFDLAITGAQPGSADVRAEGAMIQVRAPGYRFTAHDNPVAVARLEADRGATITFASGVTLTPRGDKQVGFTAGSLSGVLRADDLSFNGLVARVGDEALIYLDEPQGAFDQHRGDITDAIGEGHVGAEATFNKTGDDLRQDVVSYGNVTMTTMRAERGNLTIQIQGNGTEGRVLVFNVESNVIGAQRAEDLAVKLDNQTLTRADDLSDALNPDNDGFQPEYYVVFDPQAHAFQMIVTVPHYSVHTLSVATAIEEIPPSVLVGAVLGIVILVPSAFVLFRRPKA
ncbi:MAG: hypothetical protein QOE90_3410 [Thermoplasmata archaeon]|jgi:hypothetical protein|nr:hypothetical protein [Thermoplasmata archaeon]